MHEVPQAPPCGARSIELRQKLRRRRALDSLSCSPDGTFTSTACKSAARAGCPSFLSAASAVGRLASSSSASISAGIASTLPNAPRAPITPFRQARRASRNSSSKTCWSLRAQLNKQRLVGGNTPFAQHLCGDAWHNDSFGFAGVISPPVRSGACG